MLAEEDFILSARTSIPPNIPWTKPRSLPILLNFLACYPLILSVIPLSYILRHRDLCIRAFRFRLIPRFLPRIRVVTTQAEEFECLFRSGPRTYISGCTLIRSVGDRIVIDLHHWSEVTLFTCVQVVLVQSGDHSQPMLDLWLAYASLRRASVVCRWSLCVCRKGTTLSRRVGRRNNVG